MGEKYNTLEYYNKNAIYILSKKLRKIYKNVMIDF